MIPRLPATPTADECRAYLRWLDASPYAHHLDDDPRDCGFPTAVGARLNANIEAVMSVLSGQEAWDVYAPSDAE